MDSAAADALVHAIVRDWRSAPLPAPERALCAYAERLTRQPAAMSGQDVQALRDAGWSDEAIHDATQIIGFFNYINRVADGLGVERETFIQEWGASV